MEKEQTIFKTEKAPKTFILALDGDVDFKPDAVLRLLERMLKNPDVGAACGRIIPKGRGKLLLKSFQILSKTFKMHIKVIIISDFIICFYKRTYQISYLVFHVLLL